MTTGESTFEPILMKGSGITYARLGELSLWERNYNRGDVDAIKASIARFGFNGRLRYWKGGVVLAGNHSLMALRLLKAEGAEPPIHIRSAQDGEWLIPVTSLEHLDEKTAEAFAIADNRTHDLSRPDERLLAGILKELRANGDDLLTVTGYDGDALEAMLFKLDPSFDPLPDDETPRLDRLEPYTCPHCNAEVPRS